MGVPLGVAALATRLVEKRRAGRQGTPEVARAAKVPECALRCWEAAAEGGDTRAMYRLAAALFDASRHHGERDVTLLRDSYVTPA